MFLFAPVVTVILFSFNATASPSLPFTGFSLEWYDKALSNPDMTESLKNTVIVAVGTAVMTAILGTNASFALARRRGKLVGAFSAFVVAPLILPGLFIGVALLAFLAEVGLDRTLLTVMVGHVLVTMPFVVLILNARLRGLDPAIQEAARDLGASSMQAFRMVTFPLVRPALVGALFIVVAWSVDEFIITLFTSGESTTLPVTIWGMLRRQLDPSINAMASIIIVTTIIATIVAGRLVSGREIAR
jgi:spermidine/putrescine transport system permease protein